ncbi:hypothetical protein P2318_34305 [Myxococcaceae bacterium GXIMD 01537]
MKKAKNLWTLAALAMGVGLGFGVAFTPAPVQAWPGEVECVRNSDCDAKCGGAGAGVCSVWKCYCLR